MICCSYSYMQYHTRPLPYIVGYIVWKPEDCLHSQELNRSHSACGAPAQCDIPHFRFFFLGGIRMNQMGFSMFQWIIKLIWQNWIHFLDAESQAVSTLHGCWNDNSGTSLGRVGPSWPTLYLRVGGSGAPEWRRKTNWKGMSSQGQTCFMMFYVIWYTVITLLWWNLKFGIVVRCTCCKYTHVYTC